MLRLGDVDTAFEQAARLKPMSQPRGRSELIAGIVRGGLLHEPPHVERIHEVVEQCKVARDRELFR